MLKSKNQKLSKTELDAQWEAAQERARLIEEEKAARKDYVYTFTRTIYLLFLQIELLQNSTSF